MVVVVVVVRCNVCVCVCERSEPERNPNEVIGSARQRTTRDTHRTNRDEEGERASGFTRQKGGDRHFSSLHTHSTHTPSVGRWVRPPSTVGIAPKVGRGSHPPPRPDGLCREPNPPYESYVPSGDAGNHTGTFPLTNRNDRIWMWRTCSTLFVLQLPYDLRCRNSFGISWIDPNERDCGGIGCTYRTFKLPNHSNVAAESSSAHHPTKLQQRGIPNQDDAGVQRTKDRNVGPTSHNVCLSGIDSWFPSLVYHSLVEQSRHTVPDGQSQ